MATIPRTRSPRQTQAPSSGAESEQRQGEPLSATPQSDVTHDEPTPEEVAAEAAKIYPASQGGPTPDEVAAEAYAMYVARGAEHGHDVDDWLEAERSLQGRPAGRVPDRERDDG